MRNSKSESPRTDTVEETGPVVDTGRRSKVAAPYPYRFDAKANPKTAVFLDELRAEATRRNYARDIVRILKNESDRFLDLPKEQKETIIREHIRTNRGRISDAYLCSSLVSIKSLLERYEQQINWISIKRTLPKRRHAARDRAPTKDEVRRLMKVCDLRLRAAVLVLASSGMRAGGLSGLQIGDYAKFEWKGVSLGRLIVYRGDAEEYVTFISPEAVQALEDYLAFRVRKGDKLTPESPLFRNKYGEFSESRSYKNAGLQEFIESTRKTPPKIKNEVRAHSLQQELYDKWREAGVRGPEKHGRGKPFEFKACHGFRKYFRTHAPIGMQPETARDDVELLLGHIVSYHKPTMEHLCDQYVRALPAIAITEAEELAVQLKEREDEFTKKISDLASKTERDISSLRLAVVEAQLRVSQAPAPPSQSPSHTSNSEPSKSQNQ